MKSTLQLRGELRDWLEESVTVHDGGSGNPAEGGFRTRAEAIAGRFRGERADASDSQDFTAGGRSRKPIGRHERAARVFLADGAKCTQAPGRARRLIVKTPPSPNPRNEAAYTQPSADAGARRLEPASPVEEPDPLRPQPPVIETADFRTRPKSRRWSIFG